MSIVVKIPGLICICRNKDKRKSVLNVKSGIIKLLSKNYFYKIENIKPTEIKTQLDILFPSPKILATIKWGKTCLNFYEYIEARHLNGHTYLSSLALDTNKLIHFFGDLTRKYTSRAFFCNQRSYTNSSLFEGRFLGSRPTEYYGKDMTQLIEDLYAILDSIMASEVESILKEMPSLIQEDRVFGLTHGDLHDINFSYDGVFWDLEHAGYNPLLADAAIALWFYSKQRYALLNYNNWFIQNNCSGSDNTNSQNYIEACNLMIGHFIEPLFVFIEEEYPSYKYKKDFLFFYLCRALYVDNILSYTKNDRLNIYHSIINIYKWAKDGVISDFYNAAEPLETKP